jgi:hypothetical protein
MSGAGTGVRTTEHFVTLFDSTYMLSGLALHESLVRLGVPFHLWIVATNELAVRQLARLCLAHVTVIPLPSMETPELLAVKPGRSAGEYCWTLTPFTTTAVLDRDPSVARVTYVDADLYFFDDPAGFLDEFERSGADVLITEHAYAPEYDRTRLSGRFCVQFLTVRNTPGGREVMDWWQRRCIEWCFARYEDGKFGDQKYLDQWPDLFGSKVHVLEQVDRALAPWNVDHFSQTGPARPVFFHMQAFRVLSPTHVKLFHAYRIRRSNRWIYDRYLAAISRAARRLREAGFEIPTMPEHAQKFLALRRLVLRTLRKVAFVELEHPLGSEPDSAPREGA